MAHLLPWLLSAICLMMGVLLLARGLGAVAAARATAGRFRALMPAAPFRPVLHNRLLALWGKMPSATGGALAERLAQAGFFSSMAAPLFAVSRLAAALAAAIAVLVRPWIHHGHAGPKDAALTVFAAFLVHRGFALFLTMRAAARRRAVRRELPCVLDLMLMVLGSGVSIDQTLQHAGGHIGGIAPLCARALGRYLADIEEGMPYDRALDRLAQRLAIDEGRDFAGLLKQNLYHGGEVGPPLRRLAADIGEARLAQAREQVGRKSVHLTLAMLAFFMPVLMLVLAGPAVSDLMGTLGHVARDLHAGARP